MQPAVQPGRYEYDRRRFRVEAELFDQIARVALYWTQVHFIVCNCGSTAFLATLALFRFDNVGID